MRTRTGLNVRAHSGLVLATASALGLASACLNPAISDEPPRSESVAISDSADAGTQDLEPSSEALPEPPSASAEPARGRRDERPRNPTRR
jgi:hypothetical protein